MRTAVDTGDLRWEQSRRSGRVAPVLLCPMGPPGRAGPRLGGRLPAHPCTASEARPPASRPGLSDSSCVPVASRARTAVSSGILPHPHALRMQFLCPSRLFCVPNSSSLKTVLNFTFCW